MRATEAAGDRNKNSVSWCLRERFRCSRKLIYGNGASFPCPFEVAPFRGNGVNYRLIFLFTNMEDTKTLVGNLLVAQSGGPTPVINASLAGVISSALQFEDDIEEIYGAINGVEGILNENLIDLAAESQQTVRLLNTTPGAALGSCRYKLRKEEDFARILEVFKAHNIRYFHYIGGNDSQDSSKKIADYCAAQGYELRVIGVPKTIDNDLPVTDHCPGYGSTIKYIATTVRELTFDSASLGRNNLVTIV